MEEVAMQCLPTSMEDELMLLMLPAPPKPTFSLNPRMLTACLICAWWMLVFTCTLLYINRDEVKKVNHDKDVESVLKEKPVLEEEEEQKCDNPIEEDRQEVKFVVIKREEDMYKEIEKKHNAKEQSLSGHNEQNERRRTPRRSARRKQGFSYNEVSLAKSVWKGVGTKEDPLTLKQ